MPLMKANLLLINGRFAFIALKNTDMQNQDVALRLCEEWILPDKRKSKTICSKL